MWNSMTSAPKGQCVLVRFSNDVIPSSREGFNTQPGISVAYHDAYYAEGGAGHYEGYSGWVEPMSGEAVELHYSSSPVGWLPLPELN